MRYHPLDDTRPFSSLPARCLRRTRRWFGALLGQQPGRTTGRWHDDHTTDAGEGCGDQRRHSNCHRRLPHVRHADDRRGDVLGLRRTRTTLSDSSAYCWGAGSYGQLGDGSRSNSSVPIAVFNLPGSKGATGTAVRSRNTRRHPINLSALELRPGAAFSAEAR
jgi:hypothetical protein